MPLRRLIGVSSLTAWRVNQIDEFGMQSAISSKRHKAREFPRFFCDLIRLGIKRSVIIQILSMGGKDAVNHGSILFSFPVDIYLRSIV